MTDIRTLDAITRELDQAREDVALLQRLNTADDRVKRLIPEQAKAKVAHDKEEAAKIEAVAERHRAAAEARFAGLADLRIIEHPGNSLIQNRYIISYTRESWDGHSTVPQPEQRNGFLALDPHVLAWIVQRHAGAMPAAVMALAPDNIDEALDRYFVALKRGHLDA